MAKRMLIDSTHPEETRVAVISGNRLEEFDFESARKKQIKGNVYLAKVTRVEPSLQACFVEYGGNRHGFLAFNEIHPDYYRIPVADREALNRMVAEAMAAQDDDEEQEERRPRARRRGRGRRRGGPGDSGEAQSAEAAEDNFSGSETGQRGSDSEQADIRSEGYQPDADAPSGSPSHDDDAPRTDTESRHEDETRHDPAPLDMAPAERMASEPVDERRQDDLRQDADFEPRRETYGAAGDDVAAVGDRTPSSEDAPTEPPSFEGDTSTPRHDDFSDSPAADVHTAEGSTPGTARSGDTGEAAPAEESVETVGGDEVEDVRRKHRIWQRRYKIQEVIRKRQILLVQVAKEERGNKGAALTTYISLAGRYCVLMPNTPRGGGISRKITSHSDRKRLKDIVGQLEVPDGMAVIVRTAGMERSQPELRRDLDFLLKTWDGIREKALDSTAPALIYEEANLIKRAVRDLYAKDVEEIIVDGDEGFEAARSFMSLLMPSHIKKVAQYTDKQIPLFHRFQVESQIDNMHIPSVQLRSGGYIVLSPTEALVAIDVNSGRSTRERNIEETATRTNLEAADEVARQLRLRDLAGLIVIDFIDMEESRNRHAVERRLKEALRHDRARIQVGRISPFGLLEMSRQRLRPSLVEASMMQCPHCNGAGHVRSTESMSLTVLRGVEEEGLRQRTAEVTAAVPTAVALYIFNHKRTALAEIEKRHNFRIILQPDDTIGLSTYRILRSVPKTAETRPERPAPEESAREDVAREGGAREGGHRDGAPRGGSPRDGGRGAHHTNGPVEPAGDEDAVSAPDHADENAPALARDADAGEAAAPGGAGEDRREGDRDANGERRGRRRGRRGGRRRRGRNREDDQGLPVAGAERPNESTLGPFGEESAPDAESGGDRHVSQTHEGGEPAPAEAADNDTPAPSWERARSDDGNGRDDYRARGGRNDDRGTRDDRVDQSDRVDQDDRAPPAAPPPVEPVRVEAQEPVPAPVAEPAPPPPPAEPAAPPKRGWWNLRRG